VIKKNSLTVIDNYYSHKILIMKTNLILIQVILLLLFINFNSNSQNIDHPYVPGELIVKFKANQSAKTSHLKSEIKATVKKSFPKLNMEVWNIDGVEHKNGKVDVLKLIEQYKDHNEIEFIDPNYLYNTCDIPNDIYLNEQWALNNYGQNEGTEGADIDAINAWEIQSDSPDVVVGIVDTGVDWKHPDLINNIWQNLAEDTDNDGVLEQDANGNWRFDEDDIDGIDNDGNGYIDDFIGWNFLDDNNQPFNYDPNAGYVQDHGTHVAGIIGATGNNGIGVTGVSQNVQMALLKFLSDEEDAKGNTADAIEAIEYALTMNIPISNNSWGGGAYSRALELVLNRAGWNEHLFVAAAGNGGFDFLADDNDLQPFYPASYLSDGILSVANTNRNDVLSLSSNYGGGSVDIASPGTDIFSCLPFGNYGYKSGTSMAAPFVTASAALLHQKYPTIARSDVKNEILFNVDTIPELSDKCVSSGRLNLLNTISSFGNLQTGSGDTTCRLRDSLALVALYHATDGDNWLGRDGQTDFSWDLNNPAMNLPLEYWGGVHLNIHGCVTTLNLFKNNLIGTIPPEIEDLKDLKHLSLRENSLSGTIPVEITNLAKLTFLDLGLNELTGSIPSEISNLTQLTTLQLGANQLSSSLPNELFGLFRLKNLYLAVNNFSGNLSSDIGNLVNLKEVSLLKNQFSGTIPATLGNLQQLETIRFDNNLFSGSIPAEIGSLVKLNILYLNNNELAGSIPPEFGHLTLEKLYLQENSLSGCLDPFLTNLALPFDSSRIIEMDAGNSFDASWVNFIANGNGSCWASTITQVWPGDLNYDGMVDNDDIVYYGIARNLLPNIVGYDREGPVQNNVGNTNWEAQLCPDWNQNIFGINAKHQDANGDGVIDTLDYQVIIDNFGQDRVGVNESLNTLSYESNGIELSLIPFNASLNADGTLMTLEYDLYINEADGEEVNLSGLSCDIKFNTYLESDPTLDTDGYCLSDENVNSEYDVQSNTLQIGFTNTDGQDIVCTDPLARAAIVIIVEDYPGGGELVFLEFEVDGIISQGNNRIEQTTPKTFYGATNLNAFSNPNDLTINVSVSDQTCSKKGVATVSIIGGTAPYTIKWNTGETTQQINDLSIGSYSVEVIDATGINKTLSFHVYGSLIPEYDESGNLIECDYLPNCPTTIDFDEYIPDENNHVTPSGTYTANASIYTSGDILQNDEVELKAGNLIRILPGFSMKSNTKLSIKIESCDE